MKRFMLLTAILMSLGAANAADVTYNGRISAILKAKCVQCHGGLFPQGRLKLNSLKNVRKGGKSGRAFKPGDAAGSLMVQQFYLPETNPKRMPPQGAPPLTQGEILAIRAWIDGGAK